MNASEPLKKCREANYLLTKLLILCHWQDKHSRHLFTGYASTDIKEA